MSYSKYIVHFEDETAQSVIDAAEAHIVARGGSIVERYTETLRGFAASIPDDALETLAVHEGVAGIEADGPVSTRAAALLASLPK